MATVPEAQVVTGRPSNDLPKLAGKIKNTAIALSALMVLSFSMSIISPLRIGLLPLGPIVVLVLVLLITCCAYMGADGHNNALLVASAFMSCGYGVWITLVLTSGLIYVYGDGNYHGFITDFFLVMMVRFATFKVFIVNVSASLAMAPLFFWNGLLTWKMYEHNKIMIVTTPAPNVLLETVTVQN